MKEHANVLAQKQLTIALASCIGILLGIVLIYGISTTIVFCVWNLVVSPLANIAVITWLQAFLITLGLSLVGGFFRSTVTKSSK